MLIFNQAKQPIRTLDEWLLNAPPAKGDKHWKDGRSAKELAKAWMVDHGPVMPPDLSELLRSHAGTVGFQPEWAVPEYETKLDHLGGSGRNHDLIAVGDANGKKTLIAIEAKVDESFGEIISRYIVKSVKNNPRSKVPERIEHLSTAIFGFSDAESLRYQLVHAVAGTLIEAKNQNAEQAVFVIHEFLPFGTKSKKARQNDDELQLFMELLTGNRLTKRQLIGPIFVPGSHTVPGDIPLYIGKIETDIG